MTAREIASAVRARERSAVGVLDEHLARIQARETDLHAFNLVMVDEARAAATELDARVASGDDPGPLEGLDECPAHHGRQER